MAWEWLVERRLKDAIEAGMFEDLPGRGRPLDLKDDSSVPDEWRLAFRLLKSSGHAPVWIELRQEALARLETASQDLRRAVSSECDQTTWLRASARFVEEVELVNRLIDEANLRSSSLLLQLPRYDAERIAASIRRGASTSSPATSTGPSASAPDLT